MANQQLSSDVQVTAGKSSVPNISQRPGHKCCIVGVSQRGPVGVATLVQSWKEFVQLFGWFTATADGTLAVWNFYQETGGTGDVYFTRVVHYDTGVKTSDIGTVTLTRTPVGTTSSDTLRIDGKTDGTHANVIKTTVGTATDASAEHFNLQVLSSGVIVETWKNLTMDSTATRYVETIINDASNGSDLITAVDLEASGTVLQRRPIDATSDYLTGGNDGLVGLVDTDFNGTVVLKNGIYANDDVSEVDLLYVANRATSSVANAETTYCDLTRGQKAFAILDVPSGQTKTQAVTYVETTAAIQSLTQCAAVFWPWVRIDNPDTTVFGTAKTLTVPAGGVVMGVFARAALATKMGKAVNPAGLDFPFFSVRGFEGEDDARKNQHEVCAGDTGKATRDLVFPERINPLRKDEGTPYYLDGEYTLNAGAPGSCSTTGKQLALQAIMKDLARGLQPVRHRNHTLQLEDECRDGTDAYMRQRTADSWFATDDPTAAYTVDFGPGQNTAESKQAFNLNGQVQAAFVDPAIFINVQVNPLNPTFVTVA